MRRGRCTIARLRTYVITIYRHILRMRVLRYIVNLCNVFTTLRSNMYSIRLGTSKLLYKFGTAPREVSTIWLHVGVVLGWFGWISGFPGRPMAQRKTHTRNIFLQTRKSQLDKLNNTKITTYRQRQTQLDTFEQQNKPQLDTLIHKPQLDTHTHTQTQLDTLNEQHQTNNLTH